MKNEISNTLTNENLTWSSIEELADGIFVFHDLIPKNSVPVLESVIQNEKNEYNYSEAMVGYAMKMPEYRDCLDFKYKKTDILYDKSDSGILLRKLWDNVYNRCLPAVNFYTRHFNIGELRYWEAMNFVKYGPGQHFNEHHDHGFSYNCVVSLVGYPNDDYEGGEIHFTRQDLKIKPNAGDLFIFPSNFMYPHKAMPVKSGIKYSIVTMLDYSDKFHKAELFQETGS